MKQAAKRLERLELVTARHRRGDPLATVQPRVMAEIAKWWPKVPPDRRAMLDALYPGLERALRPFLTTADS